MKFMDYGKMAAAYLNLKTNNAVRVVAREDSRERAKNYFPDVEDKYKAQLEAYKIMSDEELFDVMDVKIEINPEDMPGKPLRRVKCEKCGEHVQDMRDLTVDGMIYCRACAKGTYYKVPEK
jgi:formylmethanofuran dehydrogenase subunit E